MSGGVGTSVGMSGAQVSLQGTYGSVWHVWKALVSVGVLGHVGELTVRCTCGGTRQFSGVHLSTGDGGARLSFSQPWCCPGPAAWSVPLSIPPLS